MESDPSWYDENVKSVLIDQLVISEEGGQVRYGGIVPSHVQELADDIYARGLECPVTIDSKNCVVEGNHRVKAYQALARKYPKSLKWKKIKAYRMDFADDAERRAYQLQCNAHPPHKESTNQDYAMVIREDLEAGLIDGLEWKTFNSDIKNYDKLVEYVADYVKPFGKTKGSAKAIAKLAALQAPNGKVQNYTKDEILQSFNNNNNICWTGKRAGDIANQHAVYPIGNESHIFPNLTGNTFNKKTTNGQVSTVAVIWESNTFGKDGKALDGYRANMLKKINLSNNSWLLSKGTTLVDEVYIAPQKLRDGKEGTGKFFRVRKDAAGCFNPKSIPTSGWK